MFSEGSMFNERIDVLHPCTNPQLKLGVIKMSEGDVIEYTDAHEIALPLQSQIVYSSYNLLPGMLVSTICVI